VARANASRKVARLGRLVSGSIPASRPTRAERSSMEATVEASIATSNGFSM